MNYIKIITIAILMPVLAGCATTDGYSKLVASWNGRSDEDLVASWGNPSSIYTTKNGSKFIEYQDSHNSLYYIGTRYHLIEYDCKTTFKVKDGTIQSCTFRGNNCVAD